MDADQFDTLTARLSAQFTRRRSLGLLGALGVAGAVTADGVSARKKGKRRKKKCSAAAQATLCANACGPQTLCGKPVDCGACPCHAENGVCCDIEGTPCTSPSTCCSRQCDFLVGGGTCSSCKGHYCDQNFPCCGGEACTNSRCGGCLDRAIVCTSNTQCCFSNCDGGACLSDVGGRCKHDADCRTCYSDGQCRATCQDGVCVR